MTISEALAVPPSTSTTTGIFGEIAPPAADVVQSPLPPPEKPPRPLGIGRKVDVPEYGEGEIRGVDGDKVLVAFADGQTRKFKRD